MNQPLTMMTFEDNKKLAEIHRLLEEAYDHYFDNSDGHCKSGEGDVEVYFGNYWDRKEGNYGVQGVSIYSYVLGPARQHHFGSLDEALEHVRTWHADEMATNYEIGTFGGE